MEKGMRVRVPLALFCPANVPEGRMKVTCVRELGGVFLLSQSSGLWLSSLSVTISKKLQEAEWNGRAV